MSGWFKRRRARVALVALALVLVLPASVARCGRDGPPEGGDPAADDVAPPADRPLLGADVIALAERIRFDGAGQLEQPRDLAVDPDGNFYVLDFASPTRLLKFDPTGQFLLRFGSREPDQERLVSALEFTLAPWNTVMLVDRGQNALVTFLTLGTFASSIPLTNGIALDVHALPAFGEFYLHKWVPDQQRSTVLYMRSPYDSLATTYEVAIPPGQTVREEARGVHYLTAVDRQGQLYVAFHDGYPVRLLAPDGRTVRMIDLDRLPLRKSPAAIAAERAESLARLRAQAPGVNDSLLIEAAEPDSLWPLIRELAVDPQDRLWVRTVRPDATDATPYDVFNERGEYLARVDVPGAVERATFGPDGTLYVISAAAPGGPRSIVGYTVRLGDAGAAPPDSVTP